MRNKQVYQEKITRLESTLNKIGRSIALNNQDQAYDNIEQAKAILSDMQAMVNREEEYYN